MTVGNRTVIFCWRRRACYFHPGWGAKSAEGHSERQSAFAVIDGDPGQGDRSYAVILTGTRTVTICRALRQGFGLDSLRCAAGNPVWCSVVFAGWRKSVLAIAVTVSSRWRLVHGFQTRFLRAQKPAWKAGCGRECSPPKLNAIGKGVPRSVA